MSCFAAENDFALKALRQADPPEDPSCFSHVLGNTTLESGPNISVSDHYRENFPPAHKCSHEDSQTVGIELPSGPNQACLIHLNSSTASQSEMPLVKSTNAQQLLPQNPLTGHIPSSSISASSQQPDICPTSGQALRAISATATNTACTVEFPDTAEMCASWPQLQQSNPPHAGRLPNPSPGNWRLVPVVQSSKAGRLKRKLVNTDTSGVRLTVGHKQASQQRAGHIKTSPSVDLQPTLSDSKVHTPEATTQLTAENPVNAQACEGKSRSVGSNSAWLPGPSQVPPMSDAPSVGRSQPASAVTKFGAITQQEDALTTLPSDLVLAEQVGCKEQQVQPAQQAQQACKAQQAEPAQQHQRTQEAQEPQHKLLARAEWMQTLREQLLAEAQKAEPRTVEEVRKDVQHQKIQRHIRSLSRQQCQALADKAQRGVPVPVQLPDAQAAEAAQRSEGMAVRDCALPLQDGHIICPEARPVMVTLQEVHQAAACQQVVNAGAICFWPPLFIVFLICYCRRDSLAQQGAFQSMHASSPASDNTWDMAGNLVIPIGWLQPIPSLLVSLHLAGWDTACTSIRGSPSMTVHM